MPGIAPTVFDGFELIDGKWAAYVAQGNNLSFQTIAALAGGAQPGATQISAQAALVNVATVASANDSVKLNFATAGRFLMLVNPTGNNARVWANNLNNKATGILDTINGVANGTPFVLTANKSALLFCPKAGIWGAVGGS